MNMVEKVARAILAARHPMTRPEDIWIDPSALADARAAIAAMREPTLEMLKAGEAIREGWATIEGHAPHSNSGIYAAMVDAALNPPS